MPSDSGIRSFWHHLLVRLATPPLDALAQGRLRATLPLADLPGAGAPDTFTPGLEILGRTLTGLAPWLELKDVPADEAASQSRLRQLALAAIRSGLDPASPDRLNFTIGTQPLVDAAFLAHALLRAPQALWAAHDSTTRDRLVAALRSTRIINPWPNNWLLFSAMVEAALLRFTGEADLAPIAHAVDQHEQWYKGDGAYGDGADFHWDYYNGYVIQPMLLDVLSVADTHTDRWRALLPEVRRRAERYALVQERLIAPDGSFPALGRSLTYRCGAFQHLAQLALQHALPAALPPAQVRGALTAVIRRTLTAPGTFDNAGWLRPGLCGHQPGLAETYISTASLYLCTTAFLPLGLPASDEFWSGADMPLSSQRLWSGVDLPADQALKG
ncbi:MAG: DUF2264 domain-containing protein [Opitutaceae bacterium]|nr:DUF2264 domain-containing protein [Opitutaceae bacterium]